MKYITKIIYPLVITSLLVSAQFNPLIHQFSAGIAILSGIFLSLVLDNPYRKLTQKIAPILLTWSVIGLGFGMNLTTVAMVGLNGLGYTVVSITLTIIMGLFIGYYIGNQRDTSVMITLGTAICGGSAIAAIAPIIRAKPHHISVAFVTIFILNAIALFIFPSIGHLLQLSQEQFGLWCALAIHDTSSVVGATLQYGEQALEIGTTIKLARALWIIPVSLMTSVIYSKFVFSKTQNNQPHLKIPWFILGFLGASAFATWIPSLNTISIHLHQIAEQLLIATLFCIGSNLSREAIRTVGSKPIIQGILLWLFSALLSLIVIFCFTT